MDPELKLIDEAEAVTAHAQKLGSDLLVIGAVALAGHRYVRFTQDLDLAENLTLERMKEIMVILSREGYVVELHEPDADDPLSGVMDIHGEGGVIQVSSFVKRFPAVMDDALKKATMRVREDSPLRIIPLPHLVVMKLYAGGLKSKADVVEVLSANPETDLDAVQALCEHYRVSGFAEIRQELNRS